MDYLFSVHVFQSVAQFADYLSDQRFVGSSLAYDAFERPAVYPFHDYAAADGRMVYYGVVLAYSAVAEREANAEILFQELLVHDIAPVFFFQGLIYEESAVLASAVQHIEPIFRSVDELKIV